MALYKYQSIVFDEASISITYYDEETRNEAGMMAPTAIINPLLMRSNVADLIDALDQLLTEWHRVHRDHSMPLPPPR